MFMSDQGLKQKAELIWLFIISWTALLHLFLFFSPFLFYHLCLLVYYLAIVLQVSINKSFCIMRNVIYTLFFLECLQVLYISSSSVTNNFLLNLLYYEVYYIYLIPRMLKTDFYNFYTMP